ncbi:MAG: hypothetical protein KC561_05880 [Myxococcales bacterium]|nr:hypothetical protein [Myxococcales bacterium]
MSIKTINFPDARTGRFTKNYSRVDNELRAEATDYHTRQPYSVLVAVLFLPVESCDDGKGSGASSFGAAVQYFRGRIGRSGPNDNVELFEAFFIGLYDQNYETPTSFFDVASAPPRARRPKPEELLSFDQVIARIVGKFQCRNEPEFEWAAD